MKARKLTRRQAIAITSTGFAGAMLGSSFRLFGIMNNSQLKKLAINGGEKIHPGSWPQWPYWDQTAEPGLLEMFLRALNAEGIPCSGGYGKQNMDGLIEEQLGSRGFKRLFPESRLRQWREENQLPGNDQLCDQALTFYQSILLGTKSDMDDIANAITKIYENRNTLI